MFLFFCTIFKQFHSFFFCIFHMLHVYHFHSSRKFKPIYNENWTLLTKKTISVYRSCHNFASIVFIFYISVFTIEEILKIELVVATSDIIGIYFFFRCCCYEWWCCCCWCCRMFAFTFIYPFLYICAHIVSLSLSKSPFLSSALSVRIRNGADAVNTIEIIHVDRRKKKNYTQTNENGICMIFFLKKWLSRCFSHCLWRNDTFHTFYSQFRLCFQHIFFFDLIRAMSLFLFLFSSETKTNDIMYTQSLIIIFNQIRQNFFWHDMDIHYDFSGKKQYTQFCSIQIQERTFDNFFPDYWPMRSYKQWIYW